jgi:hypothetical protein
MTDMEKDAPRFASGSPDSPANSPPVRIRYTDHVLFRRVDVTNVGPAHRETCGWIVAQDDESITIVHDRSLQAGPKDRTSSCGLVLLRALVESIEEVGRRG